MTVETPYLNAIQAIPGDTPSQKLSWVAKMVKERLSECNSLEEVVEAEKIPRPLAPLVQVQAAMMLNKKDRGNQSTYAAIAEALKSEDMLVVDRALQARCFFDGSNKSITNVEYFFDHLFAYVSKTTRTRIIKKLSIHLTSKDLAEQFFNKVASTFGLEQALPLLPACEPKFMYRTILDRKIQLSRRLVKRIFRDNPDVVAEYLKLSKPKTSNDATRRLKVDIHNFTDFLAALIKRDVSTFVELYEMHENCLPHVVLSNKLAMTFLKNGKAHLHRKPKLYINLLPLRMISASCLEKIYSKLFPENIKHFHTDHMLNYLNYYPREKKLDLFMKSYHAVYGSNVCDDSENVTPALMKMLPAEERIKQANIKLTESDSSNVTNYIYAWRCYLPTSESIPPIKEQIAVTPGMTDRANLMCQMIYTCSVNNDDPALLQVLTYLGNRHKNEQSWFTLNVFECLLNLYDLPHLSEAHWKILLDIIMRAHAKKELQPSRGVSQRILEAAIHHKIIHDQPIDQLIGILVEIKSVRFSDFWNILQNYPQYERMCLEACLAVVSQRYNSETAPWKGDKIGLLYDLAASIYHFNTTHLKRNTRIERMSVKNYPWLYKEIERVISTNDVNGSYTMNSLCELLQKHEKDLFERCKKHGSDKIDLGTALFLLKKSPESILEKWEEYLKACIDNSYLTRTVKRFLRATRWYKEIPMKFVERCLEYLAKKEHASCLIVLAVLVHGHTFARIIDPLIPANKTIDVHQEEANTCNYHFIYHVPAGIKLANPPVPLILLARLCESENFMLALSALTNVCKRTSLIDVVAFAKTLTSQKVSVRKQKIRLLEQFAPRDQVLSFLSSQWETEKHYSVQEVMIAKSRELFYKEPEVDTWSVLSSMISTLTSKNETSVPQLIQIVPDIPTRFAENLVKELLKSIDNLAEAGVPRKKINSFISSLLQRINLEVCNHLPKEFTEDLVQRFLFHPEEIISDSAASFVTNVYLGSKFDFQDRMEAFRRIFAETVANGWNVPHSKKLNYYPVNHAIHKFIQHFVMKVEHPELIQEVLATFLAVLTPQKAATPYLLLVYKQEQMAASTPKEYGRNLSRRLPELIKIFTPLFVPYMSNVLRNFVGPYMFKNYDSEDFTLGVMDGLMEAGRVEDTLMASQFLTPNISMENIQKYNTLAKFSSYEHPAIKSIVCDIINRTDSHLPDT